MNRNTIIFTIMAFVSGTAVGTVIGGYADKKTQSVDQVSSIISDIRNELDKIGAYAPENEFTINQTVNGYLSAFGDKYLRYDNYDATTGWGYAQIFNNNPLAVGCGFEVKYDAHEEPYISDVKPNSVADKAGFMVNDRIISIDGNAFTGDDPKYLNSFYGDDGTECTVVVNRDDEEIEISFKRLNDEASKSYGMLVSVIDDVNYVKINSFLERSYEYLVDALKENAESGKPTIVDLRDNKGGQTAMTVNIAAYLGASGVVHYHSYYGNDTDILPTCEQGFEPGKIVVLVNEKTASAAEIQTALLKQYADATIVGTNTFGKGIYQLDIALDSGGILHYTDGDYTVGEWECYHKKGIEPDIVVEMDSSLIGTDDDIQLKKALEILR